MSDDIEKRVKKLQQDQAKQAREERTSAQASEVHAQKAHAQLFTDIDRQNDIKHQKLAEIYQRTHREFVPYVTGFVADGLFSCKYRLTRTKDLHQKSDLTAFKDKIGDIEDFFLVRHGPSEDMKYKKATEPVLVLNAPISKYAQRLEVRYDLGEHSFYVADNIYKRRVTHSGPGGANRDSRTEWDGSIVYQGDMKGVEELLRTRLAESVHYRQSLSGKFQVAMNGAKSVAAVVLIMGGLSVLLNKCAPEAWSQTPDTKQTEQVSTLEHDNF